MKGVIDPSIPAQTVTQPLPRRPCVTRTDISLLHAIRLVAQWSGRGCRQRDRTPRHRILHGGYHHLRSPPRRAGAPGTFGARRRKRRRERKTAIESAAGSPNALSTASATGAASAARASGVER